ncbi:hypothetical protein E2C01_051313 [Portunus trituberculatus]|uniref:Uncharacterized protein n=1 Tax=Portunus trituberculatus TaxID=210409 RepID=A0A5B7GIU9_PORTR|nr:hypothetical protein [Portunus trituberculatus]
MSLSSTPLYLLLDINHISINTLSSFFSHLPCGFSLFFVSTLLTLYCFLFFHLTHYTTQHCPRETVPRARLDSWLPLRSSSTQLI